MSREVEVDDECVVESLFFFPSKTFLTLSLLLSYQTRELQDRAENGDDHPEDREAKRYGPAERVQVAAVDLLGARGERRRRRRSRSGRGRRLDGRAWLLLREHFERRLRRWRTRRVRGLTRKVVAGGGGGERETKAKKKVMDESSTDVFFFFFSHFFPLGFSKAKRS